MESEADDHPLRVGRGRASALGLDRVVETHRDELQKRAVAYINSDGNGRASSRRWFTRLTTLINDVTTDIQDPEKHILLQQRARLQQIGPGAQYRGARRDEKNNDVRIRALGDGSDYTAFIDYAGVSALNIVYGGEDDADSYHSIYDDFSWYTKFMDTDFSYGARWHKLGNAVMRLADAE